MKNPAYADKIVLANGGVIETDDGTDIISVDSSGNATVSGATFTPTNLTTTGNTTLGDAVTDTTAINGATTISSVSASALTVGKNGATNPVLKVDASASSIATGLSVTGAAAGNGAGLAVISSGTNENLTIDARGSGTMTLQGTATGNISLNRATTVNGQFTANGPAGVAKGESLPAGGSANASLTATSTANFGIYFGSGAPSVSAAKGSLYLRSDGSGVNDRMYVNTDGAGTWTAVTTAA